MLFILFFIPLVFLIVFLKLFRKEFLIEQFLYDRIIALQEYSDYVFYINKKYFLKPKKETGISSWASIDVFFNKLTASLTVFWIGLKISFATYVVFNPLIFFFVKFMNTELLKWFGFGFLRFSASIHTCSWIEAKLTEPFGEVNWMSRKASIYIDRDYIFSKKYKKTVFKPKNVTKKYFGWIYQLPYFLAKSVYLVGLLTFRPAEYDERGFLIYKVYHNNIASSLFMGADVIYFYLFITNQKTGDVRLYHLGPINTTKKLIRIGFKTKINKLELINSEFYFYRWYQPESVYFMLQAVYFFFKKSFFAFIVAFLFLFFSFSLFQVSLLKLAANWLIVLLFAYWLISGFNFFLKRYKYGKYSSALQRFWKRAFMCFWMIEGFLFILFFYYFLNSSAEPTFMYDQNSLYLEQLSSWNTFMLNAVLLVFVINIILILTLTIKNRSSKTSVIFLSIITLFFLITLLTESYQFYYVVNYYDDTIWTFSEEDNLWELEYDVPRTRTRNHYITLCILAKFWHFIFIFIVWVFCIMKFFELGKLSYNLISVNYQNAIILYIMNWLFMVSWAKWFLHRFFETPYTWFFTNNRAYTLKLLTTDIFALATNSYLTACSWMSFFKNSYVSSFHYFIVNSNFSFDRTSNLSLRFMQSLVN